MEALPQSQQGDRPAFLAALRYMVCAVRGASDGAAVHRAEVERALGSKTAAALLIFGVARASKMGAREEPPHTETLGKKERAALPEAVIRVVELAKDMQMTQDLPADWLVETARQFPLISQSLNVGQLQTLAEAGLCAKQFELAYAVSAAGLERGGAYRSELSAAACTVLAAVRGGAVGRVRRGGSAACAPRSAIWTWSTKAVELLADSPFGDLSLTPEQAATVVQKEKAERAFPTARRPGPDYSEFFGEALCNCPKCRRARGEAASPFEDFEDFEEDDDDADLDAYLDGMELPPDMPPEIARVLLEETQKSVERGESLDSLLNRVFGSGAGFGRTRKKGRRR